MLDLGSAGLRQQNPCILRMLTVVVFNHIADCRIYFLLQYGERQFMPQFTKRVVWSIETDEFPATTEAVLGEQGDLVSRGIRSDCLCLGTTCI
jgi:hypothetical protein